MRVAYVSPSMLPSRAANSVHVSLQCEGLVRAGAAAVTLYAKRSVERDADLMPALREHYGIDTSHIRGVSYYSANDRAMNVRIAALALASMKKEGWPDAIISRNLYASFALAVLQRRPLIFETHQLERGIRKVMQGAILAQPRVTTLVISQKLAACLAEYHGRQPSRLLVLHDAAVDGIVPINVAERRRRLERLVPIASGSWEGVCGYFGHLYRGRGIEIIERMARERPRCLYLVYGGTENDVEAQRKANRLPNLIFGGHVPHRAAREIMLCVDVLLMPYQESVSIGISGHDTARWMSPMKMFEYMASGVPIIASDLPALREILKDGHNAILVPSSMAEAWIAALDRLLLDPASGLSLGTRAHEEYQAHYTWRRRGERILQAASAL
jgi:hypothetical protein